MPFANTLSFSPVLYAIEPIALEPKFGGVSAKEKLLLSLVGGGSGGRIKSFEPVKKPEP